MAQWQGVHYSDSDVLHMQQEAIRRVRQMQQRARQNLGEGIPPFFEEAPDIPAQPPAPMQPSPSSPKPSTAPPIQGARQGASSAPPPPQGMPSGSPGLGNGLGGRLEQLLEGGEQGQSICRLLDLLLQGSSPISGALSALGLDGERLLLLGLLLLLWNEQADRTLLLALGYLLL